MMRREDGCPEFPIWLLGDSNPRHWEDVLVTPLDPRHPARHNIWTSVLEIVNDQVFRACRSRLDGSRIYIRNAVEREKDKPTDDALEWTGKVTDELEALRQLIRRHNPRLLLSFGAFAFEFARRVLGETPHRCYSSCGARELGAEFRERMNHISAARINLLPLLHISISGGKCIQSHDYYCNEVGANYFQHVGSALARTLLENREQLPVWIE